jgi:hypothetical protein
MQRKEFDEVYSRSCNAAFFAITAWPIVLYFLTPWIFINDLIGMGLLALSFAQYFWVPDAFARWMTKDLKVDAPVALAVPVITVRDEPWLWCQKISLPLDFTLWLQPGTSRTWASQSADSRPTEADPADSAVYWAVHTAILDDPIFIGRTGAAFERFQIIYIKAVLNHRREREFIREWPVPSILVRLETLTRPENK